MHLSPSHFLAEMFPEFEGLRYQSVLETVSFLLISSMLIGLLVAGLSLMLYEL